MSKILYYKDIQFPSEKDMQVNELRAACEMQVKTSEKAVGDYKSKVELQMNSMFADMKNEVCVCVLVQIPSLYYALVDREIRKRID